MRLPDDLRSALDLEVGRFPARALAAARERLTARYRADPDGDAPPVSSGVERAAYLATRFPATFAATRAVLREAQARLGDAPVRSVLDLGAGPGTAAWAALDVFPSIERVTLVERDPAWIEVGRRIGRGAAHPAAASANWIRADLTGFHPEGAFDLVIAAYALGELDEPTRARLAINTFASANVSASVTVEPGTPRGFGVVRAARDELIRRGATILAPCTHEEACPMAGHDWCRFVERLPRSKSHKDAKEARLGYEDEPYSYVVASKSKRAGPSARIVGPTMRRGGHVLMDLCGPGGLRRVTVSRKDGERYREARNAKWGGAIDA